MKSVRCPSCGAKMKGNGKTSAGGQRWRCPSCGTSTTVRRDADAAALREFPGWLMSKGSQLEMPGRGRSFRRRTARFWEVWPMPVADGEWHRVLYVDGIWLARDLVVLICRSDERVVSWCMARSETSRAWSALMDPTPAPDVVVADGGPGFASAVRRSWPGTRVQRCVLLASIYFSPFSPTYFRQSRQRGCAGFANADAPLSASRLPPPSRPHRRWIRPSGGTTVPLS